MDTKEHIQNVAIRLFSEKGFDGVSIRDIAKEANVNIAMISYYFKSKEHLLEGLVDDVINKHFLLKDQIETKEIPPIEKLLLIINHSINDIIDNFQTTKIFALENKLNKRKEIAEKIGNLTHNIYGYMKELIMQHNSNTTAYNAEMIPLMIYATLFEFVSNPSIIEVITKGKISNLNDPDRRTVIKEKLIEFMSETTLKLIN